jgi:hypothetical protein
MIRLDVVQENTHQIMLIVHTWTWRRNIFLLLLTLITTANAHTATTRIDAMIIPTVTAATVLDESPLELDTMVVAVTLVSFISIQLSV